MDLNFTPEEQSFRAEVRAFIDAHLPADLRAKVLEGRRMTKEDYLRWHRILYRQGWVAPHWPKAFGGAGWNAVQQHIFHEECADAGAPALMPFGLVMVGPVIMAFGTPAQQAYFLPRILSGEHWWCQGYSEPGSGSDLASLKTRAERRGDVYIVNGQKTWTTLAQYADWMFCLVRTDPQARKQEGISFLLIDMKSPGISVRPIIMLDGEHEVNEVFFDNVEVPVANRIGEENKGWTYAKFLLAHERTGIAEVGRSKRWLKRLKAIAARERACGGGRLIDDPRFRDRIAQVEIELMALEVTTLRVIAAEMEKKAPGPEASLLKIRGSEIQQTLSELLMLALGPYAAPYQPAALDAGYDGPIVGPEYGVAHTGLYFNMRKTTIYGGSNEIQRNIIAKMMLGF
ncbi:Acyl-CoA dehydrogenase, middle domain [Fontimonas thermophila]|uniref:Acyl-CoA dehydrogenase, middle domain n=1 Tax=Fontimonas thermophila TaxID=1076937 RepID=A0A1I2JQ81_9GAMM|nr:acyl-CoA dehydrogenase family protein [Fontimonas thermophila]SFF56744.1 Acyl-CoA dehydrogenase, middle domain [Fontimonas thermophila]